MSDNPIADFLEKIPANALLGLRVDAVGDGSAVITLPARDETTNHVGTVHAAALFAIADACSGGAVSSGLGDKLFSVTPIARGGEIDYRRPARGDITGRAEVSAGELATVHRELEADGVTRPDVMVTMSDADGETVAEATFHWHIKMNT